MSFDISRLTNAVNKYLNSISDVGAQAAQAAQEIADKTRFQTDLNEAIKQNIASKTRDVDTIPDIGAMVQNEVKSATAGIDETFQQINGAFLEISEAGKSASLAKDSAEAVTGAEKSGSGSKAGTNSNSSAAANLKTGNTDAYAGTLSADALKELSGSGYFSTNLVASSLFKDEDEDSSSGSSNSSASAFATQSLEQLNTNSLLASALGTDTATSDALTSALNNASSSDSSDMAKALIKAYTQSAKSSATTSIFGDFTL